MKYKIENILWGVFFCLTFCWTLTSCNDVDNVMKGRSYAHYTFVNKSDLKTRVLENLTVTALHTVIGDSILLDKAKSVSTFTSPLSYVNKSTVMVFGYTNLLSDTITIYHTNNDHFVSLNAGVAVYHQLDSIKFTRHLIDTIQIINPLVDTNEKENIRILY